MPMAGQREQFIPLRKSELVDLLCTDKEISPNDDEVRRFREFCRHLGEHFHLAYYRHHERMKDSYAPFDPDSEAVTLVRLDGQERSARLDRLFRELAWLVERGNFRELSIDEIHAAMAGLDILLHPSNAEGLGTAVIDAMALGVPPIAFQVGGLPELIQHERSGLLVPAGDTAAFAEATARLVLDSTARAAMAAAGPERATQFSVDRMVQGTQRVYDAVIARGLALSS